MASDAHGSNSRPRSPEYSEGAGAAQTFQDAMKRILSVSKSEIIALETKAAKKRKK
jgi:hypothetical protein